MQVKGFVVGTMLDGNKELSIKIRGLSNDSIESTQFLSVPSQEGFDYSSNYGEFEVTNQANLIARDAGRERKSVCQLGFGLGLLPSQIQRNLLADKN